MPTAKINGVEIHYEVAGEGPPVVWLHGLGGSIAQERTEGGGIDGLARRGFRLIMYDARGHGTSGFTEDEADYTWEAHARDMQELLDHLGIGRATVGGGSMGAGVSITLALAHPERVDRLVLVSLPPLADEFEPVRQLFRGFASLIESLGLVRAVEVALQLPQYIEMKEGQPEEYERLRQQLLSLQPRGAIFARRGIVERPWPGDRLGEITAPTLIVAHPDDPLHPLSSAEKARNAIAGSRVITAPSMMYYRDHRGELAEAVAEFLRGDGGAK